MLSNVYFIVNFTFALLISIIGIIVCCTILCAFVFCPACRNSTSLLNCNTSFAVLTYLINNFIVSIYGFREDWAQQQPRCSFRAYCFLVSGSAICYSYLTQAISRLFYTILHQYQNLRSYRIHSLLIFGNWFICFIISIEPFFIENGFKYESESRLCTLTTQTIPSSVYSMVVGFTIPLTICLLVYLAIFVHARRSTRRLGILGDGNARSQVQNMKRELKLARNMLFILTIFLGGGTLFLIIGIWQIIAPSSPPPEAVYILIINSMSSFVVLMVIALFVTNKPMKDFVFSRLF